MVHAARARSAHDRQRRAAALSAGGRQRGGDVGNPPSPSASSARTNTGSTRRSSAPCARRCAPATAARVAALVGELHVADIADLLEQIDHDDRRALIGLAWADIDPEVLAELEEGVRDDVLGILEPAQVAEAARELETDDVVYLVEDLDEEQRRQVLAALDPGERLAVAQSLTYPEYSAGRLMQRELVAAPPYWTVGQMIDFMRAATATCPSSSTTSWSSIRRMKPIGTIPLSQDHGGAPAGDARKPDGRRLPHRRRARPQEDVAYAFNQYHLVSARSSTRTGG